MRSTGMTLAVCALAQTSQANEFDAYKDLINLLAIKDPRPVVANVSSGFGASSGIAYAAVSYSNFDTQSAQPDEDDDGSIVLGIGLGDPNNIAFDLALGLTSVSTSLWGDGKFADEGNINLKLHRRVGPIAGGQAASVSIGASNLAGWGSTTENPVNYYAAYSENINFGEFKQYGLGFTLGYGSAVSDMETQSDPFWGIGFGYDDYSVSVSALGKNSNLTLTWFPNFFENTSVSYSNVGILNDGTPNERAILSLSYSFNASSLWK